VENAVFLGMEAGVDFGDPDGPDPIADRLILRIQEVADLIQNQELVGAIKSYYVFHLHSYICMFMSHS
jgi:hypothetical protein